MRKPDPGSPAQEEIRPRGNLARMTLEHLERVTSRDDALTIVERALELGRAHAIPEDTALFRTFAANSLHAAIAEELGAAMARAVIDDLSQLVAEVIMDESGMRVRTDRAKPPPVRAPERVVIVASNQRERARELAIALADSCEVQHATDVFRLMQRVEGKIDRRVVVVVIGQLPGLRGPMLVALARALPSNATVVFWGAVSSELSSELPAEMRDVNVACVAVDANASVEEIVRVCTTDAAQKGPQSGLVVRPMVVLAEDDPSWRTTIARRLEREGYVVSVCADGFSALEACIDLNPILVVTDYEMPALDGKQLAELVKGRFGGTAPKVLMLTSSDVEGGPNVDKLLSKSTPIEAIIDEVRVLAPLRDRD